MEIFYISNYKALDCIRRQVLFILTITQLGNTKGFKQYLFKYCRTLAYKKPAKGKPNIKRMTDMAFDYDLDFDTIDFRKNPELYRVGRGEQGVLLVEPYKSEILKHWRFKTPEIAEGSSDNIYQMFLDYKEKEDFVGMDMARKFLQMGYTRARRYTNYKGGKKYDENGKVNKRQNDSEKAESASIFMEKWKLAREDQDYLKRKKEHQKKYG